MKTIVRQIAGYVAESDFLWSLFRPIAKTGAFMTAIRNSREYERNVKQQEQYYASLFADVVKDNVVLHGPFQGLKYPKMESKGSALYPKLMGSYEQELHGLLHSIREKNYSKIINIGCGEGYYAVGLARLFKSAKVFAFDIDPKALGLTEEMASLNNVENRVITASSCSHDYLKDFPFSSRSLIVCDCEGYEKQLFSEDNLHSFRDCDLIIETHDFIDITISRYLINLFSKTHEIKVIKSIDDIEKAKTYRFTELESFDLHLKKVFLREARPAIMEWLFLTPKN